MPPLINLLIRQAISTISDTAAAEGTPVSIMITSMHEDVRTRRFALEGTETPVVAKVFPDQGGIALVLVSSDNTGLVEIVSEHDLNSALVADFAVRATYAVYENAPVSEDVSKGSARSFLYHH